MSLTLGTSTIKTANFFDDAYEPYLWIKVNVFLYMIDMNAPEQNSAKAATICRNGC